MNSKQLEVAIYLKQNLDSRADTQAEAQKVSPEAGEFVHWNPKFRLYRIKPRAPYSITKPGSLVVIVSYDLKRLADEDIEDEEVVSVCIVRKFDGEWVSLAKEMSNRERIFEIAPKWLERVDEEEFGVDLAEAAA